VQHEEGELAAHLSAKLVRRHSGSSCSEDRSVSLAAKGYSSSSSSSSSSGGSGKRQLEECCC
jgi:hypothetical protein